MMYSLKKPNSEFANSQEILFLEKWPVAVGKRGYRVRLKGVNHQWGKDPPKEVVGGTW
jgi:hypothetical protein